MGLTLRIENQTSLPDGGPLSVSIKGKRGIDIGRDQYLDWTLPDPSRSISGKHCEVRWHDDAYWLHDISTNGTFVYGADGRLKAPHRLRDGDRFAVGHYIIVASVEGEGSGAAPRAPPAGAPPNHDALWDPVVEAAPPIDPRQLKGPRDLQPVQPDFLDYAVDVPQSYTPPPSYAPPPAAARLQSDASRPVRGPSPLEAQHVAQVDDWAQGVLPAPPPEPEVFAVPNPRRPVWASGEPDDPWAAGPSWPAAPAASPATAQMATPAAAPPPMVQARAPELGGGATPREPPREAQGAADAGALDDFVRLVARGAGLPQDALAARNPAELADELGQLMRLVAENMKQLLDARQQAKRLARSASHTFIQALDNNPLKFAPTVDEAMRIMFGPPTRSYLDARRAVGQGFDDLKDHQVRTFAAVQQALRLLLEEFDPDSIENALTGDRGLAGVLGSRKARLWDVYLARWQARSQSHEDGMLNAFMSYFAECYDRDGK